MAQDWRERLGLERDSGWDRVLNLLAPLPEADGLYLLQEGMADTYTKWNWEHPALVGALGMLPGDGVDAGDHAAFGCARDGSVAVGPRLGLGLWERGDVRQRAPASRNSPSMRCCWIRSKTAICPTATIISATDLPAYLPGNGALLCAVAMMCAGW